MTDPDHGGNKTVFRPSPLQALKSGDQPVAPQPPVAASPLPPPPPLPAARPARAAPRARRGGGRTAMIVVFAVVTVLALGYVAVQLTTGKAPTLRIGAMTGSGTTG